jgi:D-alanine--D-alanine ligase
MSTGLGFFLQNGQHSIYFQWIRLILAFILLAISERNFCKIFMKVALLCGGPSLERGISLNSARSVMDHLGGEGIEIVPVYFDHKRQAFQISRAQLYCNTPSDFDFKLSETGKPLTEKALIKLLKSTDIVFPAMHGTFGEDGGIQTFLEKNNIPHVGSPESACKKVFDKHKANELIAEHGFYTLPSLVLKIYAKDHERLLKAFFKKHNITRAIVKPATGGSSIGVFSVDTVASALDRAEYIFSKRMDTRVVVEPFALGTEFTVILLENRFGQGVAVLPTEIEADYSEHQIFDFRKKYLPSRQVTYHCPPRFPNDVIEKIQIQAEQLWKILGMHDFARFDGWVMPDGNIWFSDFNPISGMEQNSFLFQQSARLGFSHRDLLTYILKSACRRYGIPFEKKMKENGKRKPVAVIFGGSTAERQVSLMSGTNVWLKLRLSSKYEPTPYLLGLNREVWKLPYALILNHTVEEIIENAKRASKDMDRIGALAEKVKFKLSLEQGDANEAFFLPERISLTDFVRQHPFVFLALHGGIGEDGTMQAMLAKHGVKYNGSDSATSSMCMDKWKTNECLKNLHIPGVTVANHMLLDLNDLNEKTKYADVWESCVKEMGSDTVIVKPRADGCSAGIVRLTSAHDLEKYVLYAKTGAVSIPKGTFANQLEAVEMPQSKLEELILEEFVTTDSVKVRGNKLRHAKKSGWVEVTVGVLEEAKKKIRALNPSITVAEGAVLSVEEKFQGGTGVNITPPPASLISPKKLAWTRECIANVAGAINIKGYARIDAFLNLKTGDVKVIEVNTLPGLTPSTVLYHQALAETPEMYPVDLLETIIESAEY